VLFRSSAPNENVAPKIATRTLNPIHNVLFIATPFSCGFIIALESLNQIKFFCQHVSANPLPKGITKYCRMSKIEIGFACAGKNRVAPIQTFSMRGKGKKAGASLMKGTFVQPSGVLYVFYLFPNHAILQYTVSSYSYKDS
jgi:hypothetical protein